VRSLRDNSGMFLPSEHAVSKTLRYGMMELPFAFEPRTGGLLSVPAAQTRSWTHTQYLQKR
jgi:hypothetical protein